MIKPKNRNDILVMSFEFHYDWAYLEKVTSTTTTARRSNNNNNEGGMLILPGLTFLREPVDRIS